METLVSEMAEEELEEEIERAVDAESEDQSLSGDVCGHLVGGDRLLHLRSDREHVPRQVLLEISQHIQALGAIVGKGVKLEGDGRVRVVAELEDVPQPPAQLHKVDRANPFVHVPSLQHLADPRYDHVPEGVQLASSSSLADDSPYLPAHPHELADHRANDNFDLHPPARHLHVKIALLLPLLLLLQRQEACLRQELRVLAGPQDRLHGLGDVFTVLLHG
mmetsp:Transcript_50502/g.157691  ORF Transcript_50502/g.157691 Transcript_50502/m.157691 type:complete len:220 (-) Transcript_50502:1811-2470(-)